MIQREDIFAYVKQHFNTVPDYPWQRYPEYAVLRHNDGKWYGLVMNVPSEKLGLIGNEDVDILNLKCEPVLNGFLKSMQGVLPAYHMNKDHWVTIVLNSSFSKDDLYDLLNSSYELTSTKKKD